MDRKCHYPAHFPDRLGRSRKLATVQAPHLVLGLSAPTRPGQRHQATRCPQHQIPHRGAVLLAANEARVRSGQGVPRSCKRTLGTVAHALWHSYFGSICVIAFASSAITISGYEPTMRRIVDFAEDIRYRPSDHV